MVRWIAGKTSRARLSLASGHRGLDMTPRHGAWFAFGAAALGIGALGVVTPLLPTSPFVLLAAFAFARSSATWHAWLVSHAAFGPMIRD